MYKLLSRKIRITSLRNKILLLAITICAIVPILMFATVGTLYYKLGIESLFDNNVKRVINDTVIIAENYVDEHKETIEKDINFMANFIDNNYFYLSKEPMAFSEALENFSKNINISGAVIFDKQGNIIGRSQNSLAILFNLFSAGEFLQADEGKTVVKETSNNKIRAVIRLNKFLSPTYLLVERSLDSHIISHLQRTKGSQSYYQNLRNNIEAEQAKLTVLFIAASILILFFAIFIARKIANIITNPINNLVKATQEIMHGNYSIKVHEKEAKDETMILAKAFNKMTKEISRKTTDLENANKIIDERRKFIETVLSEISTSIIVVNRNDTIILSNNAAKNLLGVLKYKKNINGVFPEITDYLRQIKDNPNEILKQKISIVRDNKTLQLLLAISAEIVENNVISYVISLDDITQLVAAQKNAAWADIAKRIAHEIKNPLTPIQLSADRLVLKFAKQITENSEIFKNLIGTINSHVEQIKTIIEEFASFARLPTPKFNSNDVIKIIQDTIFAQQTTYPDIAFHLETETKKLILKCDKIQISQVMRNILKNAAEALEEANVKNKKVNITITAQDNLLTVTCCDNGKGFPLKILENITDPYVTTKQKGMGLGLAISKKIIEDHNGTLKIFNGKKGGACIEFSLHRKAYANGT